MDCMTAARFDWLIGVYRAAVHRTTRCHRGTGSSAGISSSLTPSWTTGMPAMLVVQAASSCVSPEAETLAPVPMPVGVATGFNLEHHTGADSDQPDSDSDSDALARPMKKRAC